MPKAILSQLFSALNFIVLNMKDATAFGPKLRLISFIFESMPQDIGRDRLLAVSKRFLEPLELP